MLLPLGIRELMCGRWEGLLKDILSPSMLCGVVVDGQLVHEFGGRGSDLGKFDRPCGICVDNDGLVYVADCSNRRVQVF